MASLNGQDDHRQAERKHAQLPRFTRQQSTKAVAIPPKDEAGQCVSTPDPLHHRLGARRREGTNGGEDGGETRRSHRTGSVARASSPWRRAIRREHLMATLNPVTSRVGCIGPRWSMSVHAGPYRIHPRPRRRGRGDWAAPCGDDLTLDRLRAMLDSGRIALWSGSC